MRRPSAPPWARGLALATLVSAAPACLTLELGWWGGGFGFGDDDDDVPDVPEAILACCREQRARGEDYEACVDDALDDTGPCALAVPDAGAATDARVAPHAAAR